MSGKLYICPTPIGNLEDITIRVLNTLKKVDFIAAEDTRHSVKLLNYYEIKKHLISYHEHNERDKSKYIIEKILSGDNCALITDAGMPGISDPGEILIKEAIEYNIEIIGLPGPTASILALVVSGLKTDKFVFEGFLPNKKSERIKRLKQLEWEKRTLIIYESPHRIKKSLTDMEEIFGNRKISIARELTKKYEEIIRSTIMEVIEKLSEKELKGEIVLIVEGNNKDKVIEYNLSIEEHIIQYIEKGFSKKEAIKLTAKDRNIPKSEIYKKSFDIQIKQS